MKPKFEICFLCWLQLIILVLYTCVQAEDRQGRKARGELMDEDARLRRQVTDVKSLCHETVNDWPVSSQLEGSDPASSLGGCWRIRSNSD